MAINHLVTLCDLRAQDLRGLIDRAVELSRRPDVPLVLTGKIIGIYFRQTSTRTRTSFTAGAIRLGASCIAYGPNDLQTNTGETLADTARVLSQFLNAIVVRFSGSNRDLGELANQSSMAVINGMSCDEHPTQAIADLATMQQHFGSVEGLHVLYAGEGNSTAVALALALSRIRNARLTLLTPLGYGLPQAVLTTARDFASRHGAVVEERHDAEDLPSDADVVYATRWQTTGTSKADPNWESVFEPFRVTRRMIEAAGPNAIFMHDLPAVRGQDVDAEVLDGPRSIAFRQASNKLYAAMATLEWAIHGQAGRQDFEAPPLVMRAGQASQNGA